MPMSTPIKHAVLHDKTDTRAIVSTSSAPHMYLVAESYAEAWCLGCVTGLCLFDAVDLPKSFGRGGFTI
jgi:hypothetical protein